MSNSRFKLRELHVCRWHVKTSSASGGRICHREVAGDFLDELLADLGP